MNNTVKSIQIRNLANVTRNANKGAMIMELIFAVAILSFIVRPVVVEENSPWGERTTKVEWELPMTKLLAYIDNFGALIDRSWAGMDRAFGYTGPKMSQMALPLMKTTAQNGVVVMTAGFVDREGRFSGNFRTSPMRYEEAVQSQMVAYNDVARSEMSR